jgi:CubicO group peptidase (beta-lactamase class C family)
MPLSRRRHRLRAESSADGPSRQENTTMGTHLAELPRPLSRRRFITLSASAATAATFAASGRGFGVLAAQPATPAAIPNTLAPDASPEFRAVAEGVMQAMQQAQVPGAALGVFHGGKQESATFGVTDITTSEPVTPATRFEMGSITKTYVATAIMSLMDTGILELSVPVQGYLPDLRLADPEVAAQVTSKHLLTHTEGWYGDIIYQSESDEGAIARLVRDKLPTLPQIVPLGAHYCYNNTGFSLLGRVIEVVANKPFRQAMQDLVLTPLGAKTVTFDLAEVQRGSYAQSHGLGKAGVEVVTPLVIPRALEPAGGLWTTIDDQLRYARLHLGDGSLDGVRVLKPESVRLMQAPAVPIPGQDASAGMNWLIAVRNGQRRLQHAGETFGQTAQLVLVPDQQFAVAVLTNSSSAFAPIAAAVGGALAQYLGVGPLAPQGSPPPQTPPPTMSAEQLAEYAGRYTVPDVSYTLRLENGGLVLSAALTPVPDELFPSILPELPQDAPVTFVGPDVAVAGADPSQGAAIAFVRKPDDSIGWLASEARLYPRTGPA